MSQHPLRKRDAHPPCLGEVCRDGRGFEARPCPGCGGRKVRVRNLLGYDVVIPAEAARAYRALLDSMREEGG